MKKSYATLLSELNSAIAANGANAITGPILNDTIEDGLDSHVNKITDLGSGLGFLAQTDTSHTIAKRTIAGTTNQIDVGNGAGTAGNPTLSLPNDLRVPGTLRLTGDPTLSLEAATKQYVDAVAQGIKGRIVARAASTANVSVSSPVSASFDGVTITTGQTVLLRAQSAAAENGAYVFNGTGTPMTRHAKMDSWEDEVVGAYVIVSEGSTYADTRWLCTSDTGGTLGTTAIAWTQLIGQTYTAGAGLVLGGNEFSVDPDLSLTSLTSTYVETDDLNIVNLAAGAGTTRPLLIDENGDVITDAQLLWNTSTNTLSGLTKITLAPSGGDTPSWTFDNMTVGDIKLGGNLGAYDMAATPYNLTLRVHHAGSANSYRYYMPNTTPSPGDVLTVDTVSGAAPIDVDLEWAVGGAGSPEFSDAVFRIQDNADDTKELAFEVSGITTGTVRTLTAPDASGTLGVVLAGYTAGGLTQVGGNGTLTGLAELLTGASAHASSYFDVVGTSKGARPAPSMTGAQYRAISTPAAGLQIFDTDFGTPRWFNGDSWYAAMPMFGYAHRIAALIPNRSSSFDSLGHATSLFSGASAGQTEAYGAYTAMTTAASTNADGGYLDSVNSVYRGSTFGENGFLILSGIVLPDASYTESGASTGCRIFDGLTNQSSSANFLGADDPGGHHVGINFVSVNGGTTDTNFYFTVRDGSTQSRTDTGIAMSPQAAYRWWAYCAPQGSTIKMQLCKIVSGAASYSSVASITSNIPGGSTAMRRACGIRTINAVARNIGGATKILITGFQLN